MNREEGVMEQSKVREKNQGKNQRGRKRQEGKHHEGLARARPNEAEEDEVLYIIHVKVIDVRFSTTPSR